jgi:hypothetical protein
MNFVSISIKIKDIFSFHVTTHHIDDPKVNLEKMQSVRRGGGARPVLTTRNQIPITQYLRTST